MVSTLCALTMVSRGGLASESSTAPQAQHAVEAVDESQARAGVVDEPETETVQPATRAAGCASVELGLDLRALPDGSSASAIDMFVLGQADALRRLAGTPSPQFEYLPGAGVLFAYFEGTDDAREVARCVRMTERYLAQAPSLPSIMEPAASVTRGCRPCEAQACLQRRCC